ncbi:Catenin alpha-3, partial [Manacus vitellinus]
MSTKVPNIKLKIDPRDLQIQTFTVEKLLEPLIIQVTTLVNCPQNPSSKKKGRSKRARVLLASVEEATWNLLDKGEKIAKEAAVFKEELHAALADVRKESQALKVSAEAFTSDPCSLPRRQAVVPAARSLLAAVTRLLVLADMVDVVYLLQHLTVFQRTFESLRNVSSKSELQKTYQKFRKDLENLDYLAYKRQQDLKSSSQRDEIAAARASLKENSSFLHSICSACLEHSDVASLTASKDSICNEIQNALNAISNASQGVGNKMEQPTSRTATLGSALDELENLIVLDPLVVNEETIRPSLEKRLEAIISGAALLADSSCTRDVHRERIIAECNAIRQALQDLLSEYINNTDKKVRSNALNVAIDSMCKKTRDLRRQLRKAIIDHISDSFLDTTVPLLVLIEAAKNGREKEIKEYAAIFREHTSRLVEVANLACSLSTNEDGTKIVQMAANHIETLCPQTKFIKQAPPLSPKVQKGFLCFLNPFSERNPILALDYVSGLNLRDYRGVIEPPLSRRFKRLAKFLNPFSERNPILALDYVSGLNLRDYRAFISFLFQFKTGNSFRMLLNDFKYLLDELFTVIPEFISQVNIALESLSKNTVHLFDDNRFVDISKKVYDAIHNIRCSVMMIRTPEELEDVSDLEEDHDARSRTSIQTEGKTDRAKMTQLPEAEKEKIAEQVADFKKVKSKLDAEIEIWDDTSNDIIVLAKRMCVIMMEMTDFTRGRGPLKHTSDVINAAKMISESGSRMDVLARLIADQCPDQSCKQDLLAYLEQIKLYSHQLKICSQVKAEIQNLGGELIMSALDSVTSLIQAAKNLMNAVVQTVKMSYIASTKIIKIQSPTGPRHPVVMWRMKAPEKKPLIKREKPEEIYAAVRKGSAKKRIHPVQVMSEFRGREI